MLLTLHTETTIDSAHCLNGYEGKCKQVHGHTWLIEIWIRGRYEDRDEVGILWDFGNIKRISDTLDHKMINDVIGMNPTAENLSWWIYGYCHDSTKKELSFKVRVYETAVKKETWCEIGDF
jgi:6-pyruvoyltetrahydropterin/6-carboxytetrahydropterin synthase